MFERNPLFYSKGNGGKILIDMKTAEEILIEFGCPHVPFDENVTMYYPAILSAMVEYANARIDEAMRWRDPEVEQPENGEPVIVKYMTARGIKKYGIAKYSKLGIGNPWTIEGSTGREVVGWKPIEL